MTHASYKKHRQQQQQQRQQQQHHQQRQKTPLTTTMTRAAATKYKEANILCQKLNLFKGKFSLKTKFSARFY